MNETDTPETDALEDDLYNRWPSQYECDQAKLELCRKLERERDQVMQRWKETANAYLIASQRSTELERERDEARREAEAYAETIRQTLALLDEATAIDKPSRLAGILRERHANFASARQ